jgi:hypothetical protein
VKRSIVVLVTVTLLTLLLAAAVPAHAGDKTTICHKPGTPDQETMEVSDQALPAHLGHGDSLGPCDQLPPPPDPPPPDGAEKVTICHKPGTPAEKTLEVASEAVPAHLRHGDYLGSCDQSSPPSDAPPPDDAEMVMICHKPGTPAEKTLEVPSEAVPAHLGHGDRLGSCDGPPPSPTPEPTDTVKMTICHKAGTPAERTKQVPAQAVDGHLAHGDTLGACDRQTSAAVTQGLSSASCVWVRFVSLPRGWWRPIPC